MAKPKYMPTGYQPFSQQSNQYQQSEMLRSKVCGYLKKKIADEEQETQQYHRIELDIQKLGVYDTTYNLAKDILNEGQRKEIDGLKKYYQEICVRY